MESTYLALGSKSNFNQALRHFLKVTDIVDDVESGWNIADVLSEELSEDEIVKAQLLPIIGAIIKDKFGYSYSSKS